MSQILEGIDGVICQTDDVLIYAKNESEQDLILEIVLDRLDKAILKLN